MSDIDKRAVTKKNVDRETYSFMVNNRTAEGKAMINFLNEVKNSGDKIGNYIKKLILKDMNSISNENNNSNLSNSFLLEKLDKQEIMLKNLTNIIENQNREMSLLHKLLSNGILINNSITSETVISEVSEKEKDEDAEHEAFLKKAKKAVIAPDLASIIKTEDDDSFSDTKNEIEDDFDFGDNEDDIQFDE